MVRGYQNAHAHSVKVLTMVSQFSESVNSLPVHCTGTPLFVRVDQSACTSSVITLLEDNTHNRHVFGRASEVSEKLRSILKAILLSQPPLSGVVACSSPAWPD
jgi:hypothetical protein